MTKKLKGDAMQCVPLTAERWEDFEALFGDRGACGGCWCMWWRLTHAQFVHQKGAGNKQAMQQLLASGASPGILAYLDGEVAGWCALAPRTAYARLANSRVLKPVDDQPVWSITCFFVARQFRRRGVSLALVNGAIAFARQQGARILEGYPIEIGKDQPDPFVYTGLASTFRNAGFNEVARRSPTRPLMRLVM
ncbi:MAG: GNAT family N-acetyltransferase [Verrucomicrobiota bacterium]